MNGWLIWRRWRQETMRAGCSHNRRSTTLADTMRFRVSDVRQIGDDLRLTLLPG